MFISGSPDFELAFGISDICWKGKETTADTSKILCVTIFTHWSMTFLAAGDLMAGQQQQSWNYSKQRLRYMSRFITLGRLIQKLLVNKRVVHGLEFIGMFTKTWLMAIATAAEAVLPGHFVCTALSQTQQQMLGLCKVTWFRQNFLNQKLKKKKLRKKDTFDMPKYRLITVIIILM